MIIAGLAQPCSRKLMPALYHARERRDNILRNNGLTEVTGMKPHPGSGRWLFGIGAAIMVAAVFAGNLLQAELATAGVDVYIEGHGLPALAKFLLFAFGFPLGLGIGALGLYLAGGVSLLRFVTSAVFVLLAGLAAILVPMLFGREPAAAFFGIGGYAMLGIILLTVWLWGAYRNRQPVQQRSAVDLQGAGLLCFAMAAWNLCGVGGMPSYALTPGSMLALDTREFAVGQMKTVMVLLIAGWLFTAVGFYRALHTGHTGDRG